MCEGGVLTASLGFTELQYLACMIVRPLQDPGCTLTMARRIAELVPGCECTVVPDAGHMLYFNLFEEVVGWLKGVRGARAAS